MLELQYPFDSAYIIKKKKSIKKALLADNKARIKKNIAVLGGSTTSDIVKTMELFLLDNGIEPTFYESEYAQYFQDAMFPPEELIDFKPDIVFIHTSQRNITNYPELGDSKEIIVSKGMEVLAGYTLLNGHIIVEANSSALNSSLAKTVEKTELSQQ